MLTIDIRHVDNRHMPQKNPELLHGTLDLLILRLLQEQCRHGYEIAKRIQLLSEDKFIVGQGSLYPALHRLVKKGSLKSAWGQSETGRKVKYYELTASGREKIVEETTYWKSFYETINFILQEG